MIMLGGFGDVRVMAFVPRKLAAVDDHAADGSAVAADELGGGVHHDVRAMLDRPAEVGGREGVVNHQRHVGIMGDLGHCFDIEHVHARIADGLGVEEPRLRCNRFAEILRLIRVDEDGVDTEPAEADVELRVGAAVERAGGDDLVARAEQAGDRQELRGLSAGGGEAGDTAFERGHALFENARGRIHDAGVDIPELLQVEKSGGVFGVIEDVRSRLIDGHGARVTGGVGLVPRMERA